MKKLPLFCILFLAIIIIASQVGCSKSSDGGYGGGGSNNPPTTNCNGNNPSFANDVFPLMQTKCATNSGCHGAGSTNSGGPFTSYALINAKASNIKSQVSSGNMPKTGSITSTEKNTIICWVNNGATDN